MHVIHHIRDVKHDAQVAHHAARRRPRRVQVIPRRESLAAHTGSGLGSLEFQLGLDQPRANLIISFHYAHAVLCNQDQSTTDSQLPTKGREEPIMMRF